MSDEQPPDSPGEASGGEQHARIPDAILYCVAIPVGARLLYGALQRHKGDKGCFPSVRTLAEELGVSTRSVDAWLDALIEAGAVTVDQQGGGRRSTRYELTGKVRSVVPSTTKPGRRRSAPSVVPAATKDPRSVVLAAPQGGKFCGAGGQQVQQSHSHIAKTIEPEPSAATQRDAPAAPSVPARANPEPTNAQASNVTPSKPKRSTERKASDNASEQEQVARRAPRPPTNAIQRVEQGIKAAGVKVVVNFGKDGKRLADLLAANPEVATEDVIACYVAIAQGEYGDDYMRRRLSIAVVCAPECIGGYLNWRSQPRQTPTPGQRASPREGAAQGFARLARGEGW